MAAFTINQKQVGKNLYLYPNGDLATCTEFTAVGDNPNYKCVDENRLAPDEDTTYVWWNGIVAALDLYELQDSTTETGTINYVQIYARGKAHETAQSIDGVYKIICSPDSDCANVYKSDDIDLTNNYTTYSKVWATNPDDSAAWEWADINALCIGVECSSPTAKLVAATLTVRPDANGDDSTWTAVGDTDDWECVDEEISDEDTTYVHTTSYFSAEIFNFDNVSLPVGYIIDNIVFYIRTKVTGSVGNKGSMYCRLKSGGVSYNGSRNPLNIGNYETFSYTWSVNPNGGAAWTEATINAIQGGVWETLSFAGASYGVRLTQVYMVINYRAPVNPKIHTAQCYAKVNYDTSAECVLNKPETISTNHARNVKMLNFWNGSREVYDLNRSGKSMVLTGRETGSAACDTIICLRNMARDGNIITISELNPDYFNGDYRITSFGWNEISEKPSHFKWILSLESAD